MLYALLERIIRLPFTKVPLYVWLYICLQTWTDGCRRVCYVGCTNSWRTCRRTFALNFFLIDEDLKYIGTGYGYTYIVEVVFYACTLKLCVL